LKDAGDGKLKVGAEADLLSESNIKQGLRTNLLGKSIHCYSSVTSTNEVAMGLVSAGAVEGTVVIADEQTEGRGRQGRSWSSPKLGGVWMSVILRPPTSFEPVSLLTLVAGYSVAMAVRELTGLEAMIKMAQ
jgi:BirA family biotin operon repressor/biotin-[acetyl-CoA-carboxylase] ligase